VRRGQAFAHFLMPLFGFLLSISPEKFFRLLFFTNSSFFPHFSIKFDSIIQVVLQQLPSFTSLVIFKSIKKLESRLICSMKNRRKSRSISVEKEPQVNVKVHHFANPEERQEMLMNLAIGSQFEMRQRAILEYYGKDLVTYKREHTSKKANEFLRILSKFMTTCLEDNCPSSWQKCDSSFWEELIFTFFPHTMQISQNRKEAEIFLTQLKIFVQWLDKRVDSCWYPVVEKFTLEAKSELKICEHVLNDIFLTDFPKLHHPDRNLIKTAEKIEQDFINCDNKLSSIFEVTSLIDDMVVLTEFNTNRIYYIKDLPLKWIEQGLIMSGVIGKKSREKAWRWFATDGVYPNRGRAYLKLNIKPSELHSV
jgi:hypothetical protein